MSATSTSTISLDGPAHLVATFPRSVTVEQTRAFVKEAAKTEGFGELTYFDLGAKVRGAVDAEFADQVVVVGLCNPKIAYGAYQDNPAVALLLPCNVVIREREDDIQVTCVDPATLTQMVPGDGVAASVNTATTGLTKVFDLLREKAASC